MSAWSSDGFAKHGASYRRAHSFATLLLPFTTAPPQMPPASLIEPNAIGTSSDSEFPAADSSLNPSRPPPLVRQVSLGPAPITLVTLSPPPRPSNPLPLPPKRFSSLPAGPVSASQPPDPGNPPPRPSLRIPRPTFPPPEPPVNSALISPELPTLPPPRLPKRNPIGLKLSPYNQKPSERQPSDVLSPIPQMSPAKQREYSIYSTDRSYTEVPAPKTPQIKFNPATSSTPKSKLTFHPDATAVSNLEKITLPVTRDEFFSSNRVMSLDVTNFARYIKSKDITLVIFYNRNDPESKVYAKTISQAACSTKRANHAYAAVDCSASAKLCTGNKVSNLPQVRIYSGATCVAQMGELRTMTADILRQYVEMAPANQSSRTMACPLLKEDIPLT